MRKVTGEKMFEQSFFMKTSEKQQKVALLCLIALLVCVAAMLAGCKSNDRSIEQGTIYSRKMNGQVVLSYDAGNSYALDENGNVLIKYDKGKTTVPVPLQLKPGSSDAEPDEDGTGFFISEDKTAIVYGGAASPLKVLISEDKGKNWNTYTVADDHSSSYSVVKTAMGYRKFIGFTTKNKGWLVATDGVAMGRQNNRIFLTSDGGKTWLETGNSNDIYARVLEGAGFSNEEIGFLCFRYETDFQPAICWTQDGGATWEKLYVSLPKAYDKYNKTPLSPVFEGAKGYLPILLSNGNGDAATVYLTTGDYGKNWTYSASSGF